MDTEKKHLAKKLWFQTGLSKTQIAAQLSVSRRTITYWVKEGNWNRLKDVSNHLPSILAENCYHLMGNLTESYLSERRLTNPVTAEEVGTLLKLANTINKFKNRSTINESMEMFGFFLDGLRQRNPRLANELGPYVDEYISSRADIHRSDIMPEKFTAMQRLPWQEEDNPEERIDRQEEYFSDPETVATYEALGIPFPDEETISKDPGPGEPIPVYTLEMRNRDKLEEYKKWLAEKRIEDAARANKEKMP